VPLRVEDPVDAVVAEVVARGDDEVGLVLAGCSGQPRRHVDLMSMGAAAPVSDREKGEHMKVDAVNKRERPGAFLHRKHP